MGLLLLLGGAKVCAQTPLVLKGGEKCGVPEGDNPTSGVIQFRDNVAKNSYMTNGDWVDGTVGTHTFVVTLGSSDNEECTLHIAALNEVVSSSSFDGGGSIKSEIIIKEASIPVTDNATLTLSVSSGYAAIILWQTSGIQWRKVNIDSFTRTVTSGGGGGGSALEGKTAVSYDIPHEVKTAMYTYTFEDDNNISTTGFSGGASVTSEDHYTGSKSFKAKHNGSGEEWGSQFYIDLNPSDWPDGTKAILHFAIKGSGSKGDGKKMEVALQQNSNGYPVCGFFTEDLTPTNSWGEPYDLPTTVDFSKGATACNKLYFNCGAWNGDLFIDDVILYKITEETSGGDTHFTTDDQVANIASTAFSGLTEGNYICADVTGNPETIKLVCNGKDYALTHFNGSTLWGIKATAEMVTALKTYDSQFKGHDLTLNGIDIYKTVALGEEGNSTALTSKINNVFVELTRSFVANTWNTVCLPFVPTPAQANELFGSGYKLAKFTASGTNKMTFTTIDLNDFVAGKPYLVYPTATVSHSNKVLANVSITETEGSEDKDNGYKFKGSFEPKSFSENLDRYRFIASGNELKTPTASTLKSLRCYFEYPSALGARSFTIDEEGETTGINAVNGEGFMVNGYYNLNGQRVAQPTKGLYIVNGKKVVIK